LHPRLFVAQPMRRKVRVGHILCRVIALHLIVRPAVGHSQVERFKPRAVILNTECNADKPTRVWLSSLARKASHFGFNGAISEIGVLHDCENLAPSCGRGGAVVIDNPNSAATAIALDFRLNSYRVCSVL